MLIALISDIHDNIGHMLLALRQARQMGCTRLLCMGDLAELSTFRTLREEWPNSIDLVFGNNEYNRKSFLKLAADMPDTRHHGDEADLLIDGRRVFLAHYPETAARALDTDRYDAVFFGHTHVAETLVIRRTLVANPGEVAGVRQPASFGIYDTADNSVRIFWI